MLDAQMLLDTTLLITLTATLLATDLNDDDFAYFQSYRKYDSSLQSFEEQYTTELISTREQVNKQTDTSMLLTTLYDSRLRALEPYKTSLVTSIETLDPPKLTTRYSTYTSTSLTYTITVSVCAAIKSAFLDRVLNK